MGKENYLAHHGVKGMKWGVRHDRESQVRSDTFRNAGSGSKSMSRVARHLSDNKTRKTTKDVKKMSDAELRRRVKRLQMEKQYRTLTAEEKRNGYAKASEVLDVSGDLLLAAAAATTVATGIYKLKLGKF